MTSPSLEAKDALSIWLERLRQLLVTDMHQTKKEFWDLSWNGWYSSNAEFYSLDAPDVLFIKVHITL